MPRDDAASGWAGKRGQVPDEIRFVPVPDPNTRVEGLLSGQFDFADGLPAESYDRIAESEVAKPVLLAPFGWPVWAINHKAGLLTNLKIRQAMLGGTAVRRHAVCRLRRRQVLQGRRRDVSRRAGSGTPMPAPSSTTRTTRRRRRAC